MGDIDNTRDRLKLDELNKDARKDLFNKFVDAGGEVVSDKKRATVVVGSSKKNANTLVGGNSKGSGNYNSGGKSSDSKGSSSGSSSSASSKQKGNGIFFGLKLWFKIL